MKYHWCRYPSDPLHNPNWFVVGFRDDGTTVLPRNPRPMPWGSKKALERQRFVIGPEIPGPPEDEE